MIAAWMLWSVGAGMLFVVAALAAERLLSRGRRWAWAGAAAGTLALPVARFLAGAGATPDAPPAALPLALEPLAATVAGDSVLHSLDGTLLAAWIALSSCLALRALLGAARLARRRGSWRDGALHGRKVFWARSAGPAVVGLATPRIVLPEWVRAADPARQELILAHEEEHMRARDVQLRFFAGLALLAFPWNPAIWFQCRRLAMAVEMDCDRRVVARMPRRRRLYGALLLEVGAHAGRAPGAATAAMSEPRSFLERRLRNLLARSPQARLAQAALLAFATVFAVAVAVSIPGIGRNADDALPETLAPPAPPAAPAPPPPVPPAPPAAPAPPPPVPPPPVPPAETDVSAKPTFTPYTTPPRFLDPAEARQRVQLEFPPLLRDAGVGGTARVHIFVDAQGRVVKAELDKGSGHAALDAAAVRAAGSFAFSPAEHRGEAVPAWIALPITFAVASRESSRPPGGPE